MQLGRRDKKAMPRTPQVESAEVPLEQRSVWRECLRRGIKLRDAKQEPK